MLKRVLLNFYLTNSMNFNTEHPTLMRLIYSIKPPGKAMHENGRSDLTPRILTAESCLKLKIPLSYDNNLSHWSATVMTPLRNIVSWTLSKDL